ncbi:MAG TPA: hypothetical protein VF278_01550 [Pirellulales bacterium]
MPAAIDTAKAELHRAERRVEAAQARLDRLKRPAANAPTAVPKPPDAKLEARDEQAD